VHGVCRYLFANSSFVLIYKPNARRVRRVERLWLAQAHTEAFQTPRTVVNMMRPTRPSWTPSLAKAIRPRPFIAYIACSILRHVGFYSLVFQIHHLCLRRELSCSIQKPANQISRIGHGIHASKTTSNKSKKWNKVAP
jgi:hypothetical protein